VLHARGVPVVITSSASELNLRRLRQEAGLAVAWGLPRNVALAAITGTPAKLYGLDGELGLVAKGRRADLVIWNGDPLEHASVAERVLIGGIERDTHTRQRKLAEKYLRR
jgi:imidazolonepropionase-like amidohydrolase